MNPPSPAKGSKTSLFERFGGRFLYVSILAHVVFALLATWYVVQRIEAKRKLTFQAGNTGPREGARAIEHKVQVTKKKNTMSAPAQTKRITTQAISARVAIPEVAMPTTSEVSPSRLDAAGASPGGLGLGSAMGTGGMGGGGGGSIPFFGIHARAKRIAFLVDYSGSMTGAFRAKMEKEFEKCLHGLPQGTQVLIIPWAGPAWLLSQRAPQIMDKWKKVNNEYDNFVLKEGAQLEPPQWTPINPQSIDTILQGLHHQVEAPGGTDWRPPFNYVMEANPAPDVIFFMTDGQIPPKNVQRALNSVEKVLKKSPLKIPQVNCLWIANKNQDSGPGPMKKLAQRFKGEFVEIGKP